MSNATIPRTSYSRLSTWLRCPRKYRLRYLDEAPEECTSAAMLFGVAIHEACELFLAGLKDQNPPSLDAMLAAFGRAFMDGAELAESTGTPVDWGTASRDEWLEKGAGLLAAFQAGVDRGIRVRGTEVPFSLELAPGRIVDGVMDLVLDEGNGRVRVVDLKTAASTYGPDRLDYDLQPTIYMAAARRLYGLAGQVDFEYWLLLKTRTPQFRVLPVVRDSRDFAELIETMAEVDQACLRGVFPRLRGFACKGCEYARRCAGQEART